MRSWFVVILACLITACIPQNTTTPTPVVEVAVEPFVEPFVEPTSTPDCLHTDGVTLDLRRISDSGVVLHVSGLEPGEIPYITHSTFSRARSISGTSGGFVKGADANGEFVFELEGLFPLEGQTSSTWDIRFIHAHGVECATVTLP
jgi:hypothetical protein